MSLFDLFGKDPKVKKDRMRFAEESAYAAQGKVSERGPVSVFNPTSYDDVATMIDSLKAGKTVVVHLAAVKIETATRIIDMLSGAVYALGGGGYEMETNIYMFSPSGVEMK